MKTIRLALISIVMMLSLGFVLSFASSTPRALAATCPDGTVVPDDGSVQCAASSTACGGGDFLGFPKWYKYLDSQPYFDIVTQHTACVPKVNGLTDIYKIVAAVIELLTRLASLVAVGFVVYGGILYTTSQGNPDKTKQALRTIINALIGLAITIVAAAVVSFIAGRF